MEYKKLEEIADIFNGVRTRRYTDETTKTEKSVFTGTFDKNNLEVKKEKISEINSIYISQENDILIHLSTFSIKRIKADETGIIIPLNFAIIRLKKNYNPSFIFNILSSNQFKDTIYKLSEGSVLKFIKINDLRKMKIKIPDYETQEKYGKFLDLVDYEIQLEEKNIENRRKLKNTIINKKLGERYVRQ